MRNHFLLSTNLPLSPLCDNFQKLFYTFGIITKNFVPLSGNCDYSQQKIILHKIYMKKVRFASRIIAAASAFALCACAEELNLDNLSTEVTIGQGTTTIPLCYIKNQSLGDMINTESIDGLILDPKTGGYSLSFEGDESTFEIDGISNSFNSTGNLFSSTMYLV